MLQFGKGVRQSTNCLLHGYSFHNLSTNMLHFILIVDINGPHGLLITSRYCITVKKIPLA